MGGTGPPPRPRRVAAVVNPATRRPLAEIESALVTACPDDCELTVLVSAGPGQTANLTRGIRDRVDLVAAVGGDGTVADVATGLLGSPVPLAIVPAGSTNIVAKELGIPGELNAAARLLFGPHRFVRRDVGRCGDRCFLHMAGAGLDARFFASASPRLKRRFGWLAYVPPAVAALREPAVPFIVEVDAAVVAMLSPLVLVANGAAVGHPAIHLHRSLSAQDGLLDVIVFASAKLSQHAGVLARLVTGGLAHSPDVVMLRGSKIRLTTERPVPVQLDGDLAGTTPVAIDLLPAAIQIVVP